MTQIIKGVFKHPLFKRLLPWIAAAAILFYLFYHIDFNLFLASLKKAEMHHYIPLVIIFTVVWFLIESRNIQNLFSYFGHHLDYSTMLAIRGSTFLLMIINYGLGAGGIALYLKKAIPLLRSTGIIFYYMVVESAGIALLAVAGFILAGGSSGIQQWVLYVGAGLFIFYNVEIIIIKYIPGLGFLKKITDNGFVGVIKESTFGTYILILLQRILYFMTFIVFFYFACNAFHIYIPVVTLMALVPIIFFIGNLPITPLGLGTIQAAMLYFFRDYSPEPNILAMSIVYSVSLLVIRSLIGLYYLKRMTGERNISDAVIRADQADEEGYTV